jgi:hypothetical protein
MAAVSGRRLGEQVSLNPYDTGRVVMEGDYVVTAKGTSAYLVLRARRVRSRYPNRWALRCVRIDPDDVPGDARVHPLHWYPRRRR